MGEQVRLGTKQGKWKGRFKKLVAGGLALGGLALGIKASAPAIKEFKHERGYGVEPATLAGIAGQFKPMGAGEQVIGTDAQGNIIGGAGVIAGPGVELGRPAPQAHAHIPARLDPSKLEPFGRRAGAAAGQAAIGEVAGVVSGQQTLGGAVRGVAGAVHTAAKPRDPQADAIERAQAGALAGASVVAGAEGVQATNRDLLGQLAGKGKGKARKLFRFGG